MVTAIVLAGGVGLRLGGDIPKQYLRVNEKMIITYALETLFASERIGAVRIVAAKEWQGDILEDLDRFGVRKEKLVGFSAPGQTRQYSIWNAMQDILASDVKICADGERVANTESAATNAVFVHDAARPLLSAGMIDALVREIADGGHDGAMPVLPMKDTVYLSEDGKCVSQLLNRSQIFAGQAPEIFVFDKYYAANDSLDRQDTLKNINGSTEPAILAGMDVAMIPGDEKNFKITTQADLLRFQELIRG